MSSQQSADAVVVGAGVAGLTAAIFSTRLGLDVTVCDALGSGGQTNVAGTIENYPGFPHGLTGLELGPLVTEQALGLGIRLDAAQVHAVSPMDDGRWIVRTDGRELVTESVIVATGSTLGRLDVDGEAELHGRGVSLCATCDAPVFTGRDVAVVGNGDSAVDEALHLSDVVGHVYVISRDADLRSAPYTARRLRGRANVTILGGHQVLQIAGTDRVTGIEVEGPNRERRVLDVSGVFVFVGLHPNSAFLDGVVERDEGGHVVVDLTMATTRAGIFAAGDVRTKSARMFASAAGDGATAAISAASYVRTRRGSSGA